MGPDSVCAWAGSSDSGSNQGVGRVAVIWRQLASSEQQGRRTRERRRAGWKSFFDNLASEVTPITSSMCFLWFTFCWILSHLCTQPQLRGWPGVCGWIGSSLISTGYARRFSQGYICPTTTGDLSLVELLALLFCLGDFHLNLGGCQEWVLLTAQIQRSPFNQSRETSPH